MMSMFMAAMRQELRETGELKGLGGMSAATWRNAVEEYEQKLDADAQRHQAETAALREARANGA